MLARGSQSHDQHGENRHGLPSYGLLSVARNLISIAPPVPIANPGRPRDFSLRSGKTWPSRSLAGTETISELARRHEVSRKFLYQQVHTAEQALDQAFTPTTKPDDVLFYLPVTKAWMRQLVLALVLICHSSYRGVIELLRDLFDTPIALGTVHNIVHGAVAQARWFDQQYDLADDRRRRPRRDLPGRRPRARGGRYRLHVLLSAQPRGTSRRRDLGAPIARTGRPRLRAPRRSSPMAAAGSAPARNWPCRRSPVAGTCTISAAT